MTEKGKMSKRSFPVKRTLFPPLTVSAACTAHIMRRRIKRMESGDSVQTYGQNSMEQMAEEMRKNEEFEFPEDLSVQDEPSRKESAFQPDPDGKYRWVCEMPMMNSFFLLFEVWRVFGITALIVGVFMAVLAIISGDSIQDFGMSLLVICAVCGVFLLISIPAYWIVTKANNGKYTVLFEMDGHGVDHIQIKTDKARALDVLTMFAGQAAHRPSVIGAGMIQAAGGSLYSSFADVRSIQAVPEKNLIRLNGRLKHNQIYAEDEIFDEVYDFIRAHCINAVIRR